MLFWAVLLLIMAFIAGVLGFMVVVGAAAWVAKALFIVFLLLFIVSLLKGRSARV